MALRTKTIEYFFDTDTVALALATRRDQAAITLYIPETTSRTFRSVIVEVAVQDNVTTATALTSWLIGIKLGAVAFDDVTVTQTIAIGVKNASYVLTRDVTSYFVTNFGAGASQTCQVGTTFGAIATRNISVKLIITYEYDDAAATTRVKTVRIPLETGTAALTATLAEIGTNQVPLLDTFLPEASKVFRMIAFEIIAREATTSAVVTNPQLGLQLDAAAEALDGNHEDALVSSRLIKRHWRQDAMTTSAVHAFKMRTTDVAMPMSPYAVVLVVTYEYNHSTSTRIINSLMLGCSRSGEQQIGNSSANRDRTVTKFFIEEPGTITLVQSGVLFYNSDSGPDTLNLLAGSQAARAYVRATGGGGEVGGMPQMFRVDSGAAGGAGLTLARGENSITVDSYLGAVGNVSAMAAGVLYLNYTSDKATAGDGAHNHSVMFGGTITPGAATTAGRRLFTVTTPNIPETAYYLAHFLTWVWDIMQGAAQSDFGYAVELLSGEGPGDGWKTFPLGAGTYGGTPALMMGFFDLTSVFVRYPTDPDTGRAALKTGRQHLVASRVAFHYPSAVQWLTYHAISFTVAGTVSGYTGDGSGITVDILRSDTREWIGSVTTTVGGAYTFTWYDNVIQVYAVARQDSTHTSRSDDAVAA